MRKLVLETMHLLQDIVQDVVNRKAALWSQSTVARILFGRLTLSDSASASSSFSVKATGTESSVYLPSPCGNESYPAVAFKEIRAYET